MVSSNKLFIAFLMSLSVFVSCKDTWEEHAELESSLKSDLITKIKDNPDLSKFSEYLSLTGYDQVLASSKSFTVWAPSNQALEGLDEATINDPVLLGQFIGNHISYQEYYTQTAQPSVRVKMLNGKYLNWYADNLEGAGLISTNNYSKNGVLHIIDSAIPPKKNTWEVVKELGDSYKQTAYFKSLDYVVRVDSLATQIGVNPSTGVPIYEEGTGLVSKNRFLDEVAHIDNEDSLYTLILINDDGFDTQKNNLKPFFQTVTIDSDTTNNWATWHLTKDLVINGLYTLENIPDTLLSRYNVKVPIDKTSIKEVYRTSNGIIYLIDKVDFRLQDKFPPIIIEGENVTSFLSPYSFTNVTNIKRRYRNWASGSMDILEVGVTGSTATIPNFYIRYRVNLHSTKYLVYWRAVNDFQLTAFNQRVIIDYESPYLAPLEKDFGVQAVGLKNYSEVNVSSSFQSYQHKKYGNINIFLVADGSSPVVLDYIKLVPVF